MQISDAITYTSSTPSHWVVLSCAWPLALWSGSSSGSSSEASSQGSVSFVESDPEHFWYKLKLSFALSLSHFPFLTISPTHALTHSLSHQPATVSHFGATVAPDSNHAPPRSLAYSQ